jgi:tetratricopeptide (TPR) repeat protein
MKNLLILFLLLILPIGAMAESAHQKEIYNAFISGNMNQWVAIVKEMEKDSNRHSLTQKLELVEYYYGLTGYYLDRKNEKQASIVVVKADALLNKLLQEAPKNPSVLAFKGAFIGFRIFMEKYRVFKLGPESLRYIDKAYQLAPNDLQALTDKANALLHAPKIFGGDKPEAVRLLLKSVTLMETTNRASSNWFYLNTLVIIAKAYVSMGQPEKAKLTYEKALRKEPNFLWVRKSLYPELLKKMED